jgi:hypothetical protein
VRTSVTSPQFLRLIGRPALHCTALHCTALHCTALHCTGLLCTESVPRFGPAFRRRPPPCHVSGVPSLLTERVRCYFRTDPTHCTALQGPLTRNRTCSPLWLPTNRRAKPPTSERVTRCVRHSVLFRFAYSLLCRLWSRRTRPTHSQRQSPRQSQSKSQSRRRR